MPSPALKLLAKKSAGTKKLWLLVNLYSDHFEVNTYLKVLYKTFHNGKENTFCPLFQLYFLIFRSGAQRRGFFEVKRTSSILSSQEWNEKCIKTYIFEGNVQIHSDMVWFKKKWNWEIHRPFRYSFNSELLFLICTQLRADS